MPEFDRRVLEVLREPLESGRITISRAARQADFPARFQLIAAMNPCPCGYYGHPANRCRCQVEQVHRYQNRISGPLLDRIDMQITVAALPHDDLLKPSRGETSACIAQRVAVAYAVQLARAGKCNHLLNPGEVESYCQPESRAAQLLQAAMRKLDWSARSCHRVLKVARTIADLAGSAQIDHPHMAEAIQYRRAMRER